MRIFEFRLEKVLRWRQAQLEVEQFSLGRLAAECARWDARLTHLDKEREGAEQAVLASRTVGGTELGALARYQERLHKEKQIAAGRLLQSEQKMEKQRERLLAARRGFRLLEKLRQVRRTEWEAAVNREFDALADEAFLARWAFRSRRDPAR